MRQEEKDYNKAIRKIRVIAYKICVFFMRAEFLNPDTFYPIA